MHKRLADRLSPTVKYSIFLFGIVAIILGVIFGSFAASYLHLPPSEQELAAELFPKLIPFPFVGSLVLIAFIGTLVSFLFRSYIIPILRMAEQTRLITAANPHHRVTTEGAHELVVLARMINESADAFQRLQTEVDVRIREAQQAVREERNRLAALMSELPYGVVVCNTDGRILLYNRQAHVMLDAPTTDQDQKGGTVGLGRSIFATLERDPLVHALDVMHHDFERDQAKPALGLMTKLCGNRFIRVNMASVTTGEETTRRISGFVLSLEDITGEIEADSDRDHLLQEMIDGIQGSMGLLHKDVNALCNLSGSNSVSCEIHRSAIGRATDDIERQLASARRLFSEHRRAFGNRENVLADTLLALIAKNLEERFGISTAMETSASIWLKIDSYAIVQAFSLLAGLFRAEYGIERLNLQVTADQEAHSRLIISWPEQDIPGRALEEWQEMPLFMEKDGTTDTPGTILAKHGVVILPTPGPGGCCHGVAVTLPTALGDDTSPWHTTTAPRPVSYEFDLFHQPGQEALGKVPLRKLTFVAFDTETTGLNPTEGDEIIQLGAVRIVNGRLLHAECIDQLVNPQRPVPKSSVEIHGIDPALLCTQPTIDQVLPGFHAFATDAVLVAHNAAFDMRFLQLKEESTGLRFGNPVLDTLLLSSVVHPHQEGHSLDDIAERFGLTIVGRHTALGDALVTAEILLKLIPLLEAQGITTLEEALAASIKSPFAKLNY